MLRSLRYLVLLCVACSAFTSCENDEATIDEMLKKKTAVEEAVGVTSFLSQEGKIRAKLTAPYMLRYQADSPYLEFPRTMHVDFYDSLGNIESIVDARYAKYKEYERKVLLRDSVIVVNIIKKDTLRTSELWWDQEKAEFYTDKPVRIYQVDKTIYGTGLRAAQSFAWYDIFNISGIVLTNSDGLLD
jgi:LPS export ABC transporter protein LptC